MQKKENIKIIGPKHPVDQKIRKQKRGKIHS